MWERNKSNAHLSKTVAETTLMPLALHAFLRRTGAGIYPHPAIFRAFHEEDVARIAFGQDTLLLCFAKFHQDAKK
jgi:hypothetical protein